MRVLITGASGFIGQALSRHLVADGHAVVPLGRGDGSPSWSPDDDRIDDDALEGVDAVVHLAGESIAGRWTDAKKRRIRDSRVDGTSLIARAVAAAQPSVLVSGSAIGFYGSRGDEPLDEEAGPGSGFLADVVADWEAAAEPAVDAGVRTVFARTSLVLDDGGGSLPRMLLPFKMGVGGRLGSGDQWWSWISLLDQVRAMAHLLDSELEGPVNLAAPEPVRNRDFTSALGKVLRRPTILPTPGFAIKTLLGGEFAEEVLLASQRVVPTRLQEDGFTFEHPTVDVALRAVID